MGVPERIVLAGDVASAYPGEPEVVLEAGRVERRRAGRPPERLEVAEGLVLVAAATGEPPGDAAPVRAYLDANRAERRDFLIRSARAVETLRSALEFASQPEVDGALREIRAALRDLARASGVPIVSEAMDRLLRAAETQGAVATPSGPFSVLLAFEISRARAVAEAWRHQGAEVHEIEITPYSAGG